MAVLGRGPMPYYHQICAILRDKFANGEFAADERIPSEEQLQATFGVSRATVRQALQLLERDGLIERRPGKGSFAAANNDAVAEVKMTCLLEDLIALGIPGRSVVSDIGIATAGRSVADAMQIRRGESVFTFQRLVVVDAAPFAAHRIFLPPSVRDNLDDKDVAKPHILRLLAEKCGLHAETAEHSIEAVLADTNHARMLGVDPGTALLCVTRTSYDKAGTPIEHGYTHYRSDRTRFHITQRQRSSPRDSWALTSRGPRGAEGVRDRLRRKK